MGCLSDELYVCSGCGEVSQKQYCFFEKTSDGGCIAYCLPCRNRKIFEARAARKAQLAAMPRCQFCRRRGSRKVAGVPLCRSHYRQAEAQYQMEMAESGFGFFMRVPVEKEDVFRWLGSAK